MWIFGSGRLDFAYLLLPGLLAFVLSSSLTEQGVPFLVYAFIVTVVLDLGHVYPTLWRTFFHPAERRSSSRYIWIPVGVVAATLAWNSFGLPYFWRIVAYSTVFHVLRQFYGVLRWYQRLNGRHCRTSIRFFYLLCGTPLALFALRPGAISQYYAAGDLISLPSTPLFHAALWGYAGIVVAWGAFEISLIRKGIREWNRAATLLFSGFLYATCFLWATNPAQAFLPLMAAHGVAYLAILSLSLTRTQSPRFAGFAKAFLVVTVTAALFGYYQHYMDNEVVDFRPFYGPGIPLIEILLVSAYVMPLFCHYIFDAILWTGKHREAPQVFAKQ